MIPSSLLFNTQRATPMNGGTAKEAMCLVRPPLGVKENPRHNDEGDNATP